MKKDSYLVWIMPSLSIWSTMSSICAWNLNIWNNYLISASKVFRRVLSASGGEIEVKSTMKAPM